MTGVDLQTENVAHLIQLALGPVFLLSGVGITLSMLTARLARQLCTHCKQRAVIPQHALAAGGFRVGADLEAYEPLGCGRCSHTGYRGRIGLFSVMPMSEEIKELTVSGGAEAEISSVAREQGMLTLREDGLQKVRDGVTSIEEVARVSA